MKKIPEDWPEFYESIKSYSEDDLLENFTYDEITHILKERYIDIINRRFLNGEKFVSIAKDYNVNPSSIHVQYKLAFKKLMFALYEKRKRNGNIR